MDDRIRPYKGGQRESSSKNTEIAETKSAAKLPPPDATNLGRRAWFASLVPAFGQGLVNILRTSNHLQADVKEALRPDEK